MEKIPRHVDIDYSKYAPDIPEDQLEAYYGLPKPRTVLQGMRHEQPEAQLLL